MRSLISLSLSALGLMPTVSFAAEGMWLPGQTAAIAAPLRAAGLRLDPTLLGNLGRAPLNAIVSLSGCSAAFVSPQGLVVTNHHCVYGSVQYNAKAGQNYIENGFLAATLGDELPGAPGTRIYVIEDLRDVTAAMHDGLAATGIERQRGLDAHRRALIAACEQQPNRRCDVRPYFGGAAWYLQQQLEIKDVRLVYAPALGTGNFGGETDNWVWPRHTGDFGFYRAYVAPDGSSAPFDKANVPYRPKSWLKIAQTPLKENDFVMVAGFPGGTSRLATALEARFAFTTAFPLQQKLLSDYSDRIATVTAGDDAATIAYASIIKGADNYKKKTLGLMTGAEAIGLDARKTAEETAYRSWIAGDPSRQARYGASVTALDTAVAANQAAAIDDQKRGVLDRAQLLTAARTAYRWAKEQEKPDADREIGYQARDRRPVTERLTAVQRRFVQRVDRALFEQALAIYATGSRDAAFDAKLAETGLDRAYAETRLADSATRLAWLDKPARDFETSSDPFIRLAVVLYAGDMAREAGAKARAGNDEAARSVYDAGLIEWTRTQGRTLYPDANGSLRFTYGQITGKARDGLTWAPFTTAEGIVQKQTGHGDFDAPASVIAAIKARDYGRYASAGLRTLPVDFMSTVDITNGNSGSSTLNAKGEFTGLAFDGTLDGVISDWSYDAPSNRTIHVDSRYMLWTMDKIDHAQRLLAEMGVK